MAKVYRSARGQIVDMALLKERNADKKALGNINMNARGDLLDTKGNVIKRREQIVQDYYKSNPNGVEKVSLKPNSDESFETPAEAIARLKSKNNEDSIPDKPSNVSGRNRGRKMIDPDSKD